MGRPTQRSEREWKLQELADACGVSPRTVRYYVQRGLLPAPVFRGRDTAYGEVHRERLLAIKRLQQQFLPLDAIEVELARRSPDEIRALADGRGAPPGPVTPKAPIVAAPPRPPTFTPHPQPIPRMGALWERVPLARGLELHVAEDAEPSVRRLVEEIRRLVERSTEGESR